MAFEQHLNMRNIVSLIWNIAVCLEEYLQVSVLFLISSVVVSEFSKSIILMFFLIIELTLVLSLIFVVHENKTSWIFWKFKIHL